MTTQEQLDDLKKIINGSPTRADIISLLDILIDYGQQDKELAVSEFLDFFPKVKDSIMSDLFSYSTYVCTTKES